MACHCGRTENNRLKSIDVAKGTIIVVMVFIHLFILVPTGGGEVSSGKSNPFTEVFYAGLMLFFMIAGYFYRPNRTYSQNLKRRFVQIGAVFFIGTFVLTTAMFAIMWAYGYDQPAEDWLNAAVKYLFGGSECLVEYGTVPDVRELCGIANGFYFFELIFFGFVLFYAIADWALKDNRNMAISVFAMVAFTALILQFVPLRLPYNFQTAPLAAAFMLVGALAKKYEVVSYIEKEWKKPRYWLFFVCAAAVAFSVAWVFPSGLKFNMSILGEYKGLSAFPYFVMATAGGYMIFVLLSFVAKTNYLQKLLSFVGEYTIFILLLHTFFIKILTAWHFEYTVESWFPKMPFATTVAVGIAAIALSIAVGMLVKRCAGKLRGKKNDGAARQA